MKTIYVTLLTVMLTACGSKLPKTNYIEINTDFGKIVVQLYNETPLHRDNFKKLVQENYFDGILFHRVIDGFMIQGGDPDSRTAQPGLALGNGGPGYTVPAEFNPEIFHKKGAVAAARMGDNVNPEQASSGSQFYIVQGKVWSDEELNGIESRINAMRQQNIYYKTLHAEMEANQKLDAPLDNSLLQQNVMIKTQEILASMEPYKIPDIQREVYKTIGGTPHLDGSYTVFGQVVQGMEVIDKISAVDTDDRDRPVKDVVMSIKFVKKIK